MNQELINRAHELRDHGFTTGEIADEAQRINGNSKMAEHAES